MLTLLLPHSLPGRLILDQPNFLPLIFVAIPGFHEDEGVLYCKLLHVVWYTRGTHALLVGVRQTVFTAAVSATSQSRHVACRASAATTGSTFTINGWRRDGRTIDKIDDDTSFARTAALRGEGSAPAGLFGTGGSTVGASTTNSRHRGLLGHAGSRAGLVAG